MNRKLFVGFGAVVCAWVLFAAPALAGPRLWNESSVSTRVPLRDLLTEPIHQPDSLEFNGELDIVLGDTKENPGGNPVECREVELGTPVRVNTTSGLRLGLPWGVAEGDECKWGPPTAVTLVPTYFDTSALGIGTGSITIKEVPAGSKTYTATITNLLVSQKYPNEWCTIALATTGGIVENVLSGFSEEGPSNLEVKFHSSAASERCTPNGTTEIHKFVGPVDGRFFLETMSTATDTAFVE
jgi:hypothetical protein